MDYAIFVRASTFSRLCPRRAEFGLEPASKRPKVASIRTHVNGQPFDGDVSDLLPAVTDV